MARCIYPRRTHARLSRAASLDLLGRKVLFPDQQLLHPVASLGVGRESELVGALGACDHIDAPKRPYLVRNGLHEAANYNIMRAATTTEKKKQKIKN